MSKKALKTYEKERGLIFVGDAVDLDARYSEEEFLEFWSVNEYVGVDHESRTEWLKNNGYEVNRKNMIDHSLETVAPAEQN